MGIVQIRLELRQLEATRNWTNKERFEVCQYLQDAIFTAINESFESGRQIMDWFKSCATVTGKLLNRSMEWVCAHSLFHHI